MQKQNDISLIDGSLLIIEACVKAGGEIFVGYPITPSNWLYSYANQRFAVSLAAPDEITALQWMAGFSATGKMPVTATSFPGFALMIETLNMAFMMELPLLIILSQRLGPSTGSATAGAQGDLLLMRGCISGGYQIPVFCPSDFDDCWSISAKSIDTAINLRTPVILLTSKEMVMTNKSFNLSQLPPITPAKWKLYQNNDTYKSYLADNKLMVPPFLPLGNNRSQVRFNSSTHDQSGLIEKATTESMENTCRLKDKIEKRVSEFTFYEFDEKERSDTLIVTYGISADAAREAVKLLRTKNKKISLLIIKTLLPVSPVIINIINKFKNLIFVEENLSGLLMELLFGKNTGKHIHSVNKIGNMITPSEIIDLYHEKI